MIFRLLLAILILPVNVMITVPLIILHLNEGQKNLLLFNQVWVQYMLAILLIMAGLCLAMWTMFLIFKWGKGTPAPWDPPQNLVVAGPYQHMRNPMISGVVMVLFGEALALQSIDLIWWAVLFFLFNLIYFPLVEEARLEKKFSNSYRQYKENVPRWIPRWKAWIPKDERA